MSTTAPTIPPATGTKMVRIVIQTNSNFQTATLLPFSRSGNLILTRLGRFIAGIGLGTFKSNTEIMTGGTYATIDATLASVVATNTIVIGGITLTAVNSGATNVQFNVGGSNTITAANLATAINANTSLDQTVQATSSGAVVTISCKIPGTIGNLVTTTATGGTITVASVLAGGTDGSSGTVSHGL